MSNVIDKSFYAQLKKLENAYNMPVKTTYNN